ncbi:rhomboid family intramembrane serine protease [Pseudodesulfovibrio sediminis]|uniref:Rhomboid family intramembrane serine protease n=1 Tax=Pseudodesulfovibrio sediminis TaxID=2810563 RepID=A0ABN6EXB5_9BACT|nr:rhomboid family intramembrane serine protease [Pseudodesulfovibrio sediminis]BCS90168.1 rhomboid family intramembrane serine protease [Pseudodesulfovibrio sediminis]
MIPLRDNVPRVNRPIAVVCIIAVNVLVFLYLRTVPQYDLLQFYHLHGVVPARFFEPDWAKWVGYPVTFGGPLITYMFLHGGWLHIVFNMWMLWIFGDNIEDVTGHGWFVVFYVLCGLMAVAVHMVFEQASNAPVVGASGAVAGVMGAYIVLYPHGRVLTLVPIAFVPLIVRIPSSLFLGLWFLIQIVSGMTSAGEGTGQVAWWSHVGGFIAGVVLIQIFRRRGHCRYCYNRDTRDYDPESDTSLNRF